MDAELLRIGLISIIVGTALFVIVLGGILAYHWEKFAMNQTATKISLVLYGSISLVLLVLLWGYLPTP